jgi:hypothetical protein
VEWKMVTAEDLLAEQRAGNEETTEAEGEEAKA